MWSIQGPAGWWLGRVVVRYTRKLLLLGARSGALVEFVPTDDDWYLNLF